MERSYQLDCPVARTLDLIGERWTLLILRDFFIKADVQRFGDLETSLSGVTPAVLSTRLKELEKNGIIVRRLYSEHPPRMEYRLTPLGKSLGPVLKTLREWGLKHT
ncbi:winged helix-turn-helix transcriptional regulator [Leptospira adleri]|uniref:HTH hxlR-type domain-containing protein n=1 Tax=Leptospira adleri TaxID=2023186 RepID=A0A2M9YKM9_9LEPT|nr:helix-turn-helix domain-containing protein [Leptospira adleri]PJZ52074.1 hypothetical protein CH380_16670 [Leptospira adleri]PJZ62936.1 hypothetical protein CH376_05450 [Leptospira adleri]TGM58903.1 transcriptional regulator [Leptospira adleri]